MPGPDAVHEHARGERVVATGDGAGEFESAATIRWERLSLRERCDFWEAALDIGAAIAGIAAHEDVGARGRIAVHERHRTRRRAGMGGVHFIHLCLELAEARAGVFEERVVLRRGQVRRRVGGAERESQGFLLLVCVWRGGVGVGEQLAIALGDFVHSLRRRLEGGGDELGNVLRVACCVLRFGLEGRIRQFRVGVPSGPDRVGRLRGRGLGEVVLPTTNDGRDELALLEILVAIAALGGRGGAGDLRADLIGSEQVVGGALAEDTDLLFELLDTVFLHLVLSLPLLGEVSGVLRRIGLCAEQGFLRWLLAGGEDAVEAIILSSRDGVVFVIVAAGALDGQAHRATRHDVDAVVNDVGGVVQEAAAQREEAHGRQVGR